jgi:hypothetical protein
METTKTGLPVWLDESAWQRLARVEVHHQKILHEHETLSRRIAALPALRDEEMRTAWARYCDVIRELDRTAEQLEAIQSDREAIGPR